MLERDQQVALASRWSAAAVAADRRRRRRRRWSAPSARPSSGSPASKPRGAPKPALAKTTSMRPKRVERALRRAPRLVVPLGDVAGTASAPLAPPSSSASASSLSCERAAEHEPVAGLGGVAGGGGADARRGAGDQEDCSSMAPIVTQRRCWPIARVSRSGPGGAATGRCPSGARPTSPRAGPTAATAAAAGTSSLRCDDSLRDLQSFRRRGHYRADRGGHGLGALRHGADGDPLVVLVPPGTQVERWDGRTLRPRAARARRSRSPAAARAGAATSTSRRAVAAGAAAGREGPARRGGRGRAAPEAARRRRPGRAAERRQVVAAGAA